MTKETGDTRAKKSERERLAFPAADDAQAVERAAAIGTLMWRRRNAPCSAIGAIAPTRAAAAPTAACIRHPCYWDRKQAMAPAEWAKADALCARLRELLSLGSLKGSEGLWLF
jgi:hypothetical protein